MPRPEGDGARFRLAGHPGNSPDASTVAFVFGIPALEMGKTAKELGTNVTFMEEGGSKLITEALGAVIIERAGAETQRKSFQRTGSHHQASARLEEKGEYQISVEFVTGGHKGKTQSKLFNYTGKFMFPGHDHHNH